MTSWVEHHLLDQVRHYLLTHELDITTANVAKAVEELGYIFTPSNLLELIEQINAEFSGLGPLKPLLDLDGVTDIFVNGHQEVWIDQGHGLERYPLAFGSEQLLRTVATRLVSSTGRRLDDSQPAVDARLKNGIRIHAVIPPVSPDKTLLSLRIPQQQKLSIDTLCERGSLHPLIKEILERAMSCKLNFLISGATGSGKTALLCALLELCPANERLLIVEDSSELFPRHEHVVHLEAQQKNSEGSGEITLQHLVKHALRMRPDRLIVGECRGAEVKDLLHAFNTGHSGGCGTIHANSTTDLPARLEALCALAGLSREAAWAQINSALDVAIHVQHHSGQRYVSEISLLQEGADGRTLMLPALKYDGEQISRKEGYTRLEALVT